MATAGVWHGAKAFAFSTAETGAQLTLGAGLLELDAVLDMKLNKMLQDISLLRRLWVLILFITVILCP